MKRIHQALFVTWLLLSAGTVVAGDDAPNDVMGLTQMLNDFLAGASVDDVAVHDAFWAEDLIYTSSSGERISKADIMQGLNAPPPASEEAEGAKEAPTVYTAEDIRIQQYGDTAIVAFKLVATPAVAGGNAGASTGVTYYYNTGTFLRRGGKWQVVAWQATRIPAAG